MPERDGAILRTEQQVASSREYVDQLRQSLQEQDLSAEEVERALQPALSFHAQLEEELEQLEHTARH